MSIIVLSRIIKPIPDKKVALLSAATSLVISGLNGDRDGAYQFAFSVVAASATGNLSLLVNSTASTGSNYRTSAIQVQSVNAVSGTHAATDAVIGSWDSGETLTVAGTAFARLGAGTTKLLFSLQGVTSNRVYRTGCVDFMTSANITSISLLAANANSLGANSVGWASKLT